MTIFNIHCDDPWFTCIKQGRKIVTGRKKTHSYKKIKVGDQINFSNGTDSFVVDVTELRDYASTEQYLRDIPLEKVLPGVKSIQEGLDIYHEWNTEEKIKQYGLLAIFVKPAS